MKKNNFPATINLPVEGRIEKIEVSVIRAYSKNCLDWDRNQGRLIKKVNPENAAANWRWYRLFNLTKFVEGSRRRTVSCWHLALNLKGKNVPIASMLLSEGFPYFEDPTKKSVFIWYLCALPKQAMVSYQAPKCELILESLVNLAIERSIELGYEGRIGLHAMAMPTPHANLKLLKLYRDRCRLNILNGPSSKKLSAFRSNDGRYLYADEVLANALTTSLK